MGLVDEGALMAESSSPKRRWGAWASRLCLLITAAAFICALVLFFQPVEGYFGRDFDRARWNAKVDARAAMADDIVERIQEHHYTRAKLMVLLGPTAYENPEEHPHELEWAMGRCGRGIFPMWCWLHVDFDAANRATKVYVHRDD